MVLRLGQFCFLALLVWLVVACANASTGTTFQPAPTVPIATPTVPLTKALPQALEDVTETEVFLFRVDPTQTSVEYAVQEVLLNRDQVTRGRTSEVEGEFRLYMQNGKAFIALSNLQVDLRTLASDSALRDAAIRTQWLESDKYPKAIFVANAIEGLPDGAVQGQPYTFRVTGDLTIRNITRPVTFDVTVTVKDNSVAGEGKTIIFMKDFGFDPPNIVGQTIVSDPVTLTIKGVARLTND